MICANRGSLRFLFLMSSTACVCWLQSCDACSWNSSPPWPSNCNTHEQTLHSAVVGGGLEATAAADVWVGPLQFRKNVLLQNLRMSVISPTLASMMSPMSWTTGDSLRFFMASQRLPTTQIHRSNYAVIVKKMNKEADAGEEVYVRYSRGKCRVHFHNLIKS